MDHPEVIEGLIKTADEGKQYALERLQQAGYEVRDCRGNFIFVKPKLSPRNVERMLKEKDKILVKTYGNDLLKEYIRVSTGSKEAMEFFVDKFLLADK